MTDELIQVINDKIYFVMKQPLIDYALKKGLINKASVTKYEVKDIILNNLNQDMACELVELFSDSIGFNSNEIEKRLNITNKERKKWTKKGLLKVTGTYQTRAYGKYLDCPIYDTCQILNLTQDIISEWRSSIKPLTDRQKEGIKKAQETALKNRTCIICGHEVSNKNMLENGWCDRCLNRKAAYDRRKYWIENKKEYIILDTETTGLGYYDQIIEIAIIDLDGHTLLNTLVMPTVRINEEAYQVHGMSFEYLSKNNAPSWDEVYPKVKDIIKNKTVIAYNSDFDERMIDQTCRAFNYSGIDTNYECLMRNAMLECSSDRYIKLSDMVDTFQSHRALDDCHLCLEIIKGCEND